MEMDKLPQDYNNRPRGRIFAIDVSKMTTKEARREINLVKEELAAQNALHAVDPHFAETVPIP
jgi:hypothetical protein